MVINTKKRKTFINVSSSLRSPGVVPLYSTNSVRGLQSPKSNRFAVPEIEELSRMRLVEIEQRKCDRFWGLDKEVQMKEEEQRAMINEDNDSYIINQICNRKNLEMLWENEFNSIHNSMADTEDANEQFRLKYMKQFYRNPSLDTIIKYSSKITNDEESQSPRHESSINQTPIVKYTTTNVINNQIDENLQKLTYKQIIKRKALKVSLAAALRSEIELAKSNKYKTTELKLKSNQITVSNINTGHLSNSINSNQYNEFVDGHIEFHWDQTLALTKAFNILSNHTQSFNTNELYSIYNNIEIISLLKYTMYSSFIKRKLINELIKLFKDIITLDDWIDVAMSLTNESNVLTNQVITNDKYIHIYNYMSTYPITFSWPEKTRQLRLEHSGNLRIGEIVWKCPNRGNVYFPAIIYDINVNNNTSSYAIKYLFNQKDFELYMKSNQIIMKSNSKSIDYNQLVESLESNNLSTYPINSYYNLLHNNKVIKDYREAIKSIYNDVDCKISNEEFVQLIQVFEDITNYHI